MRFKAQILFLFNQQIFLQKLEASLHCVYSKSKDVGSDDDDDDKLHVIMQALHICFCLEK